MNFLENIFVRLSKTPTHPVLREIHDGDFVTIDASGLLQLIRKARTFLRSNGLKKGDRCALFAHNSIRWVALDLAMMAEGIIVVPLYVRQAPSELIYMVKDCGVSLICCGNAELRNKIQHDSLRIRLLDEIFQTPEDSAIVDWPVSLVEQDLMTIIYTSGTSGEPKGVMLNVGNLSHMLPCTGARLDALMGPQRETEQVFHYLPFCFAGSWILLLSCLSRSSQLTLSMNLDKLADELKLAAPQYCLNVPALLERIKNNVEAQIATKSNLIQTIYQKGKSAWLRKYQGESIGSGHIWIALANRFLFTQIKNKIGPNLKALICGSAPLSKEAQLFFLMLGILVLQVYGLTETTAICTMDDPREFTPGRVGLAIPGIEMKLGDDNEILVCGPHISPGYWNRPEATATVIRNGWFHTGDQGEVDNKGSWAVIGRIKNLIILSSGHNIAPEPIEREVMRVLPIATQVILQGNGRGYLTAVVAGPVTAEQVDKALEKVNADLPHYKNIRGFFIQPEPLTIESGLLTANGKLKRDAITAHFKARIEELYQVKRRAV